MRPHSFSKLETYRKCPAWYKFSYLDGKESSKDSYSFGLKIHEFICGHIVSKGRRKPNYSELRETDRERGSEAFNSAVEILSTLGTIFSVEERFALNEYREPVDFYDNSSLIRGKIDLITVRDGGLFIWDWKTGKSSVLKPMQLKIYMIAVSQMYPGKKVIGAGYVYLPSGRVEILRNDGSLDEAWDELIDLITTIENDRFFEPKPSRHCRYCPHQVRCPAKVNDPEDWLEKLWNDETTDEEDEE